jgi:hypothetical protein
MLRPFPYSILDASISVSIFEIKPSSANIFFKDAISSLFDSKPIGNSKTVSTGPGHSWKQ